jgi:hypothetical protein
MAGPVPCILVQGALLGRRPDPDVLQAVDSPQRFSDDPAAVVQLLQWTREVPTLTWGRDEFGAGEMWNSNSLVWHRRRGAAHGAMTDSTAHRPSHRRQSAPI